MSGSTTGMLTLTLAGWQAAGPKLCCPVVEGPTPSNEQEAGAAAACGKQGAHVGLLRSKWRGPPGELMLRRRICGAGAGQAHDGRAGRV